MADWIYWLVGAGILVALELATGTFYLLMIAVGLGFGALAALTGAAMPVQTIAAAVVAVVATGLLYRSRLGRPHRGEAARDPNVNIDIGQVLRVDKWQDGRARVKYRGALWDVELGQGALAEAGDFKIAAVHGSRLTVVNV